MKNKSCGIFFLATLFLLINGSKLQNQVIGNETASSDHKDRALCYIAHRGEAFDAPEGTRPAYQLTMDRRLPGVKLDLQLTSDHKIVMSHDSNLKRMTGKDLPIKNTKYEDLKMAVFKSVGGYDKERILTFRESLEIVKNCPLLFIDFKYYSDEMARQAFETLSKYGIKRNKVIVANFSEKTLQKIKKMYPDVRIVLHVSYSVKDNGYEIFGKRYEKKSDLVNALLAKKNKLGLFGVNINANQKIADKHFIEQLQKGGLWVSVWFINKPEQAVFYSEAGADAFVTDCGDKMRRVVEGQNKNKEYNK